MCQSWALFRHDPLFITKLQDEELQFPVSYLIAIASIGILGNSSICSDTFEMRTILYSTVLYYKVLQGDDV